MKYREFAAKLLIFTLLLFHGNVQAQIAAETKKVMEKGEFNQARKEIKKQCDGKGDFSSDELEIFLATMERIEIDFSKTEEQILAELSPYFPGIQKNDLRKWEHEKKLEMRIIDGERRYFRNAVPNLFRVDSAAHRAKIQRDGVPDNSLDRLRIKHTSGIVSSVLNRSKSDETTQKFRIEFSMKLKPGVVPAGEIVRCWMPFPRESLPRQKNVNYLEGNYMLGKNQLQNALYAEKKVKKGKPTKFLYTAEFETSAQWFNLQPEDIFPYKKNSELYKQYTAERPPHIVFSDTIKRLAEEIANGINNPLEKVKAIYYWIDAHIPWASALEYSIMENIPHYVIENSKGDCGMKTLLFMSLARVSGIPCKWQSGWMLHPGEVNLHDWCEVYYEGVGWVPLDQSFGLQNSETKEIKEFYITGIDAYRLIINDDYSREFNPPKQFYRSEPVDFQRGEMEWKGGNLYFDKWTYHMNVTYLNKE